jgi:SAM-dependent methyltransferase
VRRTLERRRAAGGVVLDVGGGTSPYRALIERLEAPDLYLSLDVAASGATTVVGDATRLPLRDGCVGLVLAIEVLQHVPDAGAACREFGRVLAPGGIVIVSFPFVLAECDVVDYRRWTLLGMRRDLEAAGLVVVDAKRRGGIAFALASLLHLGVQHLLPGARRSWRADRSPWTLVRGGLTMLLAIPTAALGWCALALDALLPASGWYVGGFVVARRPGPERAS